MPAFEEGIRQHDAEIAAIIANPEAPTFKNTIEPLEFSGMLLTQVNLIFSSLTEAETNDELQAIAKEISPKLTEHYDNISLNGELFARIKTVYENRDKENLDTEQMKVLENHYKDFVRAGALLSEEDKATLREINKELAMLSIQYGDNALAESNAFELVIDNETDLAGLPEAVVTAAADEAAARNKAGKWVFTLDAPSRIPFLQYADNRNLREKVYKAYINKADNDNEFDNKEIVSKMVNLRLKKANLLGFNTYADFALDDRMAKTDANVNDLINRVWAYAIPRAKEEVADMQKIIDAEGGGFKLAPWDWWYYAEKVRNEANAEADKLRNDTEAEMNKLKADTQQFVNKMRIAAEVEVAKLKVKSEESCKNIIDKAREDAVETLGKARMQAEKTVSDADARARKLMFEAENKAALAKNSFDDQVKKANVHRQHMINLLESQLELLKSFDKNTEE